MTGASIATQTKPMPFVRKASLPIAVSAGLACAFTLAIFMETRDHAGEALCGGRRYEISRLRNGVTPYIALTAEGVRGQFLLDYGATRSSLSADTFAGTAGSDKAAAISLPSFEKGAFRLARYDQPVQSRDATARRDRHRLPLSAHRAIFRKQRPSRRPRLRRRKRFAHAASFLSPRAGSFRPTFRRSRAGSPMSRSSISASARSEPGRRSTPAMPTRSIRTRSISTRPRTAASPGAASGSIVCATSASGPARATRAGASTQ